MLKLKLYISTDVVSEVILFLKWNFSILGGLGGIEDWLIPSSALVPSYAEGPYALWRLEPGSTNHAREMKIQLEGSVGPRPVIIETWNSFVLGSHPVVLKTYCWFCTPASLLTVFEGLYVVPGINPGSAWCRECNLFSTPYLQPIIWN